MFRAVPSPPGGFLLGNTLAFGRDVLGYSRRWARSLGDVVHIQIPGLPLYQVTHPALIETLLSRHSRDLQKDWFTRSLSEILGQGLLIAEGEAWRRRRRVLQPAFQPKAMEAYADVMVRSALDLTDLICAQPERDVVADTMGLTARIISSAMFGHDAAADTDALRRAMAIYTEHFAGVLGTRLRFPLSVPTPSAIRVRLAFMEVHAIVDRLVSARRRFGSARSDLLTMLLAAKNPEGGELSEKELRDEIVTMLLAGHETSALVLTFALDLLARHPSIGLKVEQELDQVLAGRPPTYSDLHALRYTSAVIKEVLRLYPPVWTLGRELCTDVELGDYKLPRGATVMLPQWVVHRDERWFEQPDAFVPERFLDGRAQRLPRYAYFPFGVGTRMCLGSNFAMIEAVLVLATLLSRVRVEAAPRKPLRLMASATLRPAGPVNIRFAPRATSRVQPCDHPRSPARSDLSHAQREMASVPMEP